MSQHTLLHDIIAAGYDMFKYQIYVEYLANVYRVKSLYETCQFVVSCIDGIV